MSADSLRTALRDRILISDGSTGVALELLLARMTGERSFPDGCPDGLTLSRPDVVRTLHAKYLASGSDIILTNTFGASPPMLAPFGLAEDATEVNRQSAILAREEVARHGHGWVMGSLGPGTALPSLGQSSFEELRDGYLVQTRALLSGGVDGFVVETCQDPLQAKAAISAVREVSPTPGEGPLLVVSITMTETGNMLLGTTVEAALATLMPFRPDAVGLNCGLGPKELAAPLATMAALSEVPLWLKPNAGMPVQRGSEMVFPLDAHEFTHHMSELVKRVPVAVAGGCCGTTWEHIAALASNLGRCPPVPPRGSWTPSLSSLYHRVGYRQEDSVLIVGERSNVNGSRRFKQLIERDDLDAAVAVTVAQMDEGAHAVDVCVDLMGEHPASRLTALTKELRTRCTMPLFLDSATPEALVAASTELPGRGVLNSVSFSSGEGDFHQVAQACVRTGCAMVVLAIDEVGQAVDRAHKLRIAHRADRLRSEAGLPADALFFDPLVLPVGSGQPDLERVGVETLEALAVMRQELPWMPTILGISNVGHGLRADARRVLNTVMLRLAADRGLAAAIVHAGQLQPLHALPREVRSAAEALLVRGASRDRLREFLDLFKAGEGEAPTAPEAPANVLSAIENAVIRGDRSPLAALIEEGLLAHDARTLLDGGLLRGMARVGELFKAGELQLPFVLASAEVVREGAALLGRHLPASHRLDRGTVVLATVEGDVHDIGKNLVGIILSNNGFNVVDLGIRIPVVSAFRATVEQGAVALGLSGLLIKSVEAMVRGIEQVAAMDTPFPPIIVGGAPLNESYVARELAPRYPGLLFYAKDAMHGLEIVQGLADGTVPALPAHRGETPVRTRRSPISVGESSPRPPFVGARVSPEIPLRELWPFLNQHALIRRFWRLRDEDLGLQYLAKMVPEMEGKGLVGAAIWGYWHTRPHGTDAIVMVDTVQSTELTLPVGREKGQGGRSIQDFLAPTGDTVAAFVVTMGAGSLESAEEARRDGLYSQYFLLHGLTMALTEALADYVRTRIISEWGLGTDAKSYAPGMPAFPNISAHEQFFRLLDPGRIGVTHTESWQLIPECSSSGLIIHHPEAEYFGPRSEDPGDSSP